MGGLGLSSDLSSYATFCPKNEVQMACTDLETSKYHQGSHSVDEYVNKFCELVDHAEHTEGVNIVLKF